MKEVKEIKIAQKPNASWAFEVEKLNAWAYWDQAFTPEECQKIIDYFTVSFFKTNL